jgi:hypothetical protein
MDSDSNAWLENFIRELKRDCPKFDLSELFPPFDIDKLIRELKQGLPEIGELL